MKRIFFILFFINSFISLSQSTLDTIDIQWDIGKYLYLPSRGTTHVLDKTDPNNNYSYIDSIMVNFIVIEKYNTSYYLILRDKKGTIRYEGEYYDEFPNGHVIFYNRNGTKKSEGDYKVIHLKKPKKVANGGGYKLYKQRKSVKSGQWKYYNWDGVLLKTKNHK